MNTGRGTAFHAAVDHGDVGIVKLLLAEADMDVHARDRQQPFRARRSVGTLTTLAQSRTMQKRRKGHLQRSC